MELPTNADARRGPGPPGGGWRVPAARGAALDRLLAESRPEVVALQEMRYSALPGALAADGWHIHLARGHFLASRYPVRRADQLGTHSDTEKGSVMRYELATPAGVVTVF